MDDQKVTIGEVYRLCLEIRADVKAQNSRVRKLEEDALRIKTLWTAGVVLITLTGNWLRQRLGL